MQESTKFQSIYWTVAGFSPSLAAWHQDEEDKKNAAWRQDEEDKKKAEEATSLDEGIWK